MAKKEKKDELTKKRITRTELRWEVVMMYKNGAQLPPPYLPIPPRKQISVANYMLVKYPTYFNNLSMAKVFVSRAVKTFQTREENVSPFRDKRGENRERKKRADPVVIDHTDRNLCRQNGKPNTVVSALARRGFVVNISTIRLVMKDLNIHCTKAWYTDVLTTAQKYKRLLFANPLLTLTPEVLLRVLMSWMNTDEKW